jgi:hypothetical protein
VGEGMKERWPTFAGRIAQMQEAERKGNRILQATDVWSLGGGSRS